MQNLFKEQVKRVPNASAVEMNDKKISYKELDERSNEVAQYLKNENIGRNDFVGILSKRGIETIINILGVIKAGAAYVPIDAEYPEERRKYILQSSKCKKLLDIDIYNKEIKGNYSNEEIEIKNELNDVAYVIYTSGSTGNPKGVVINHKAVCNTIQDINRKFEVTEKDNIIGLSSMCFDLSVYDIFGSLMSGATLIMVEDQRDVKNIEEIIKEKNITIWNSVPAIMDMLVDNISDTSINTSLRTVLLSGDWIPVNLPEKIKAHFNNAGIISLGGATEASIWSIYYPVEEVKENQKSIPYGKPLANQKMYILNYDKQLCPIGVQGEIYIGGIGVADGYLNDEEKTKEAFINHNELGRIYKTGDYGILHRDGNIEFLGRKDYQVKIRGYRIELGEIEEKLLVHDFINNAVVVDYTDERGKKYLCGYYILEDKDLTVEEIRIYLSKELPEYMIPTSFVEVEEIPLTANGKVDRKALSKLNIKQGSDDSYEAPQNETQKIMADVWKTVLGLDKVGINDNFFVIGGDSIKAIQLTSKLQKLKLKVVINDLFKYPTIKQLSKEMGVNQIIVSQEEVVGDVNLTSIQKWFFEQKINNMEHWNQAFMLYNEVGFNEKAINETFTAIITHHDALRMIFKNNTGNIVQVNRKITENLFDMKMYDFINEINSEDKIRQEIKEIHKSIKLDEGPLVKLALFKTSNGDHLLIVIHHLVIDGVSWRILLEDFGVGYESALKGERIKLQDKTSSYKDWGNSLYDYANSKEIIDEFNYWSKLLLYKNSKLNKSKNEEIAIVKNSEMIEFSISDSKTKDLLRSINKAYDTRINEILLTVLGISVASWTGEEKVLVDIEAHGREDIDKNIDITRTLGWFTSIYPMVLDIDSENCIGKIIQNVRNTCREVPKNGLGYGVIKYISDKKENSNFKYLQPKISFNYLGQFDEDINNAYFKNSNIPAGECFHNDSQRIHSLDITAMVIDEKMKISFLYDNNSYGIKSVEQFAKIFEETLINIIGHCIEVNKEKGQISQQDEDVQLIYPDAEIYIEDKFKPFPLTDIQMAYYLGRNNEFEIGGVATHLYIEVETKIDINRFNIAWNKTIKRHPMLRAIILPSGEQCVLKDVPEYNIETIDITNLDPEEQENILREERNRMSHHVFNTNVWPLFEFKALKINNDTHILCMSRDLIIADAASMDIFGRDLMAYYNNPYIKLDEFEFTFRDYMIAYKKFKESDIHESDKKYWLDKLESFPLAPAIPLKCNPKNIKVPNFKRQEKIYNKDCWNKLNRIALKNNVTPSVILATIYSEVLSYWSNTNKLAINLTVYNRYPFHKDVDSLVGDFTSNLLLGIEIDKSKEFWENAREIQNVLLGALSHRHYEGVEFIRDIVKYNDLAYSKANMPYVYTSVLTEEKKQPGLEKIGNLKKGITQTSQVYIDFQTTYLQDELWVFWDYVEQLFDQDMIHMMFEQFTSKIDEILKEEKIDGINIHYKDKIFIENYNNSEEDFSVDIIQNLFKEQVKRVPNASAVEMNDKKISYKELDEKSNEVAQYLNSENIGRNDFVGILSKRGIETIINILGVIKAGAAYVPIDAEYPEERRKYILQSSKCKKLLDIDIYNKEIKGNYSNEEIEIKNELNDVAYVIYTSGSTGNPKGVVINHKAVCNTIQDINRKFEVTEKDNIIGLSSMCFDLSVYDIFGSLMSGATLIMVEDQRDVKNIEEIIKEKNITIWNSVPAIMDMLVDNISDTSINTSLRTVLLSGDWIPVNLPEKIKAHFNNAGIISLGGATEASIWSIYYPVEEVKENQKSIPYGKPLANQKMYILNYDKQLCPIGVQGEIYIGGIGVADGYLNDEEKTKEAFINHNELGRIYKTGDYGILHRDGNIEFLGRKDYQVKIRGYRIELGEIEGKLLAHDFINNAVVVDYTDERGKKYLCGYYVLEDEDLTVEEIRIYLSRELPEYMIPTSFVELEEIPLTVNGKVNKKVLPEPNIEENSRQVYEAPRNELEEKLATIWSDVLKVEKIGIRESFFEVGGNSLLMVRIRTIISKELNVDISLKDFLANNTIEMLSSLIKKGYKS
ncbi:amino acid adenylation domain-containing protein, partial [Clostridium gasigenes]|uniref:amino acid adenylation domain-containing protein n=1 Tax=Clostridium gasigenes TaxID=94869 RepID=UPI00311AADCE